MLHRDFGWTDSAHSCQLCLRDPLAVDVRLCWIVGQSAEEVEALHCREQRFGCEEQGREIERRC